MHILLAEDDKKLGKLIIHMLEKEHFTVDWVLNGTDAYDYSIGTEYDLILLDWMMPGKDGVSVCRQLREKGFNGAILMLTAKDELDDQITGLDSGADDYVIKPFEFKELLARIRALLRRRNRPIIHDVIVVGEFELNRKNYIFKKGDQDIQLSSKEFRLMELFMINYGQTLPREMILDRIWGLDSDITSNTLDAYIRLLRRKIEDGDEHKLIKNIRGVGYRFEQ